MNECSLCDGTGWRPVERNGVRAVEVCSCRTHARDEQWWMEQARIPSAFQSKDLEHFWIVDNSKSLLEAKGEARKFIDNYPFERKGLFFLGNPGVGKTHLTVAIMKELMLQKGVPCLFCSYQELLRQIRDSYNPVSRSTESEVVQPVLETEVVAIDDLGAERISDWVEDTVTYILNFRYAQKKTTLLTSNLPDTPSNGSEIETKRGSTRPHRDTLTDRIGIRVRSRLHEMCTLVRVHANDFRQTVREHGR